MGPFLSTSTTGQVGDFLLGATGGLQRSKLAAVEIYLGCMLLGQSSD